MSLPVHQTLLGTKRLHFSCLQNHTKLDYPTQVGLSTQQFQ